MRTIQKSTDGVGSRHRSAYRLCNALPGAVAVVASQEGNTRFVRRTDGGVAY
jgi:DNA integrity scanning protein DisA with diadenylate cyclase activity